jgi:hypothetical protein
MTLENAPSQLQLPHFTKLSPTASQSFSAAPMSAAVQRKPRVRKQRKQNKTLNVVNNFICFLFAATAFAMIGIEASGHHGSTHTGTQTIQK